MNIFKTRYALLFSFIFIFLLLSASIRTVLTVFSWKAAGFSVIDIVIVYCKGFIFDLAVALFFSAGYSIYLLLLPEKFNGSVVNRLLTCAGFFVVMLICMFSFFAEITFWKEFDSRFNFIAVDYLVYTYEVINNINESYPLPYLIGGMLLATTGILLLLKLKNIYACTFDSSMSLKSRLLYTGSILSLATVAILVLNNNWAEQNRNRYRDELSKAGIFSFFAAFRNNELDYNEFYVTYNPNRIAPVVNYIRHDIVDSGTAIKPNVIMVTIESFSADFMEHFGNKQHLTPALDSLADKSVLFTNMYATGTRTVRGLEALSLSIPPSPGNSIVRRKNNENLFCIGSVFRSKGYSTTFFYGGDGYFDNMNAFFGNNKFNIVDRGNTLIPGEHFTGTRTTIPDRYVHFENAWGICDEDLYDAVIRNADNQYKHNQHFYDFVMTTSNHRPYTYPEGKIDVPPGSGRDGAVKYTDYAIAQFLKKIQSKPWFSNTVVIFIADHCASVAGKEEINVANYHIPCLVYNLRNTKPFTINSECSQIDLYPTLFDLLNWDYRSDFFGEDVLTANYHPRAFIGTYQKLGYLAADSLVVLSPKREANFYRWQKATNTQTAIKRDSALLLRSVGYYQSAASLFKSGALKETNMHVKNTLTLGLK